MGLASNLLTLGVLLFLAFLVVGFIAFVGYSFITWHTDTVTITGHVGVPVKVPYVAGNSSKLVGDSQATAMVVTPSPRFSRTMCDPFPCKSVSHTPVRIVKSNPKGWTAAPVEPTTTDANGDYSITVDANVLNSGGPYFVMALDPSGEYPLIATIPPDLIYAGTIHLSIDRTTTAAAVMHCPGGTSTMGPLQSHGGYCWSDPQESVHVEHLEATIDLYFADNPSTSLDPQDYLPDVSNDPNVQDDMNQILPEDLQPEGFKPIGIDGASHLLEGLGQISWGATLPQPKPTYPPETYPPQTNSPKPPPNLPDGFPTNMQPGVYDIIFRTCIPGSPCFDTDLGAGEIDDMNGFVETWESTYDSFVLNSCAYASCRTSYSYNGRTFTTKIEIYSDGGVVQTMYFIFTRVG